MLMKIFASQHQALLFIEDIVHVHLEAETRFRVFLNVVTVESFYG